MVVLVIASGIISWTSEALVFEIDISGYCAAIRDTRQHSASSVDNSVYGALELFPGRTYLPEINSRCG